jgi:cell division protein FtsI (penicillin-binding protein 3)
MSRDSMRSAIAAADTNSVFIPEVTKGNKRRAEAIVEGMGLSKKQLNLVEEDTMALNKVPDVTGMGARDAVYALEHRGVKVYVEGRGKVVSQSLPPGHVIKKGDVCRLKFDI